MSKYESILETVGRTPVVRVRNLAPAHVNLWVKLEAANPMGSVKDRLALGLIEHAERSGQLRPGQTVIEATSGNTGIGLAMVCAQKGYPLIIVMAENFSVERRRLMRFLGAQVVLTPATLRGQGMLQKARELAQANDAFLCRQFENEANADVHSATTAQEILEDFGGERLDYWVTGFGTGGTLKGVARVLKQERSDTRIVVCEPENSPVLASGIPQARAADGSPSDSHPSFRTHPVQGWAPDFIPKLTEDAVEWIDEIVPVRGDDALRLSRELARREGIFSGISGGATFAGALRLAESAPEGTAILCMLPDTGERYLSTPLFDGIASEMNEQEQALSRSTPSARFDLPAAAPDPKPEAASSDDAFPEAALAEADAFVEQAIHDADHPVVMFAFEWCEFCWSVRKLFQRCGMAYRSIDLDSVPFRQDDRGGLIREALRRRTASATVPQVFVAGEFLGGCVETLEAHRLGELQARLRAGSVPFDDDADVDAYAFLPGWLQRRTG